MKRIALVFALVIAMASTAAATNIPKYKKLIPTGQTINGTQEVYYEIPAFSKLQPQAVEGAISLELRFTSVAGDADVKIEILSYSRIADQEAVVPPVAPFYQMTVDGLTVTNRSLKVVSTWTSFGEEIFVLPVAIPATKQSWVRITGNPSNPVDTIPIGFVWYK